ARGDEPAPAPAPPAATEPGKPPPAAEAAVEVTRARQLFSEQKYDEAAQALQRAYTLDPKPLYLFNAGQSYRKAKKSPEALEMYHRYLKVAQESTLAIEARGYVSDLESLLKAQESLHDVQLQIETKESETQQAKAELAKEQKNLQVV